MIKTEAAVYRRLLYLAIDLTSIAFEGEARAPKK